MRVIHDPGDVQPWVVKQSTLALDHRWARVRRDHCVLQDGSEIADFYYWDGGDFAQVFAVTEDNEVLLVRQYKHGAHEVVLELPAGILEPHEPALQAARRELREETGFGGGRWTPLAVLFASPTKSTVRAFGFLAVKVQWQGEPVHDRTECMQVLGAPLSEIPELISAGELRDVNSIAFSYLAMQALQPLPPPRRIPWRATHS